MEIINLIDQLENLISSSTGVPATGRILLEKEKFTNLIQALKDSIPVDIQEAQDLLKMREDLINQSLQEGRKIKSVADEEAKSRLSESEIVKEAEFVSQEILEKTTTKAQGILDETELQVINRKEEADLYAKSTLEKLEEELYTMINTIRHGIELIDSQKVKEDNQ
ncbi:hypothetical protein M1N14_00995 [Dehalococcoidia bacterium]|nr:hypothetical protein [Dehalococcoidia bacterium]